MKKLLLLFVLINSLVATAQDLNLKGKWKVNCALEKKDSATFHVCDFCPTTMLKNNTAVVEEFDIEITETAIKFTTEEVQIEIPYTWDKSTYTIKFKYTQKDYSFKAMVITDLNAQILVAESGEVLYLKKLP
ncbi:MAG: hypothetical protein KBG47_13055 [Bacteroidia bacterium]|nr:hypothetical protein [Bacteroidia bacterium]